jgi:glycosyltransferase involved in cell wall biosynthesis
VLGRRPRENLLAYVWRRLRGAIPWRVRRALRALRALTPRPRLGRLRHHPPRALAVPRRSAAPHPAPTLSLVTPTLQHAEFLERTLHSVLDQAYPALEYVVIDGGSTDGTVELLRNHEQQLAHWESAPDAGQAAAINRGFSHTTGDILAWLNSDDVLLPGALAYVARFFAERPEVDAIYGHRLIVDEADRQIGEWILPPHDDAVLALADYVPQETLFWRRSLWERVGGRLDESFRYALDWDLLLRMRAVGARFARVPRFLAAFRVHNEQKTQRLHAVGRAECERLLEREHGRVLSDEEIWAAVRPYMRRHLVEHFLYVARPSFAVATARAQPAIARARRVRNASRNASRHAGRS